MSGFVTLGDLAQHFRGKLRTHSDNRVPKFHVRDGTPAKVELLGHSHRSRGVTISSGGVVNRIDPGLRAREMGLEELRVTHGTYDAAAKPPAARAASCRQEAHENARQNRNSSRHNILTHGNLSTHVGHP